MYEELPVSFFVSRSSESPVLESRPLGSVRGVLSNGHSYRDRSHLTVPRLRHVAKESARGYLDALTYSPALLLSRNSRNPRKAFPDEARERGIVVRVASAIVDVAKALEFCKRQ